MSTELPAITAAEQRAAEALWKSGACEPQEAAALARIALSAALPELPALTGAITAQAQQEAVRERVAEQDAVHADLALLLRVLGLGDHARPQSSHEVMLDAINEVGKLRQSVEAITSQAEDEEPVYEAGHSQVDWERLNRLRAAGAVESDDLADWYAEQNMLEPRVQHAAIAAQAAADEREACAQLADDVGAVYPETVVVQTGVDGVVWHRFADLLGGTADGAHTPGGAT